VFSEVVDVAGKVYIRDLSRIERGWLVEYAEGYYKMSG
jgi:ATP-dependent RNA helicase DDX35